MEMRYIAASVTWSNTLQTFLLTHLNNTEAFTKPVDAERKR